MLCTISGVLKFLQRLDAELLEWLYVVMDNYGTQTQRWRYYSRFITFRPNRSVGLNLVELDGFGELTGKRLRRVFVSVEDLQEGHRGISCRLE